MITLAYPATGTALQTITLKNPTLGDSRQLNLKTSFKQSMSGAIHSNKQTVTSSKLLLTFSTLDGIECAALKSFYRNAIGQTVLYTDQDAVEWTGIIGSDSLQITTAKDGCSYSAVIELITE